MWDEIDDEIPMGLESFRTTGSTAFGVVEIGTTSKIWPENEADEESRGRLRKALIIVLSALEENEFPDLRKDRKGGDRNVTNNK